MKHQFLISIGIMVAIALSFHACSASMDRDAQQLATFQKERVSTIKTMLETNDTLKLNIYRQHLMEQTTKYKTFKNQMNMKYKKQEEKARFEEAFRRALE